MSELANYDKDKPLSWHFASSYHVGAGFSHKIWDGQNIIVYNLRSNHLDKSTKGKTEQIKWSLAI